MIKYTEEQQTTYNWLCSGRNIFLTGGAGVGKSFIIKEFIKNKQKEGFNVVVGAPTGLAAGNIGGVTLHSLFKMPLGVILKQDLATIDASNRDCDEVLANTDILVIDEISMCRIDMFEYIAVSILKANKARKRQGKKVIQLVLVGDFFQLMPVVNKEDLYFLKRDYENFSESGLPFYSKYWKMFKFKTLSMEKVVRQDNIEFITVLNRLRTGDRVCVNELYELSNKEKTDGITICGLNNEVAKINGKSISELPGDCIYYKAEYVGEATENDTQAEDTLVVKLGARVMLLQNEISGLYHNGSMGHIRELYSNAIVVDLDNGTTVTVRQVDFEVYGYRTEDNKFSTATNSSLIVRKKVGTVRQFPLRLAYAITMHKSQGQTYEKANISPYCWECGQLYVAVSRVKSANGLHFNYAPSIYDTGVSTNVLKFYREELEKSANNNDTGISKEYDNLDISEMAKGLNKDGFKDLQKVMLLI